MVTFRPDGTGVRARIGLLTPHLDPVPETEMQVMIPRGVSLHVARAPLGMIDPAARIVTHFGLDAAMAFAGSPALRSAAARLAPLDAAATIYGFTSSSYVQSAEAEAEFARHISEWLGGVAVVLMARALVDALRALGAQRVALIHPPWFRADLVTQGAAYFERNGLSVVDNARADLAREFCELKPQAVYSWIAARVPDQAQAVAICGGGFRAIGVIEALEEALGRPVVTSNQAALWSALRRSGIGDGAEGYGRLFDCPG